MQVAELPVAVIGRTADTFQPLAARQAAETPLIDECDPAAASNTTIDKRIADIRRIVFLIYSGITSFRQAIALSVRG